jgi:large subunit ribosomal protein L16
MAIPSNLKYRKRRKVKPSGIATSGFDVSFGLFGIKALNAYRITEKQIETCKQIISKNTKGKGKYWVRVFPHNPVTEKPADVRMGNGKGGVEYWMAAVSAGTMLFELDGVSVQEAQEICSKVSAKLPISVKLVTRRFVDVN